MKVTHAKTHKEVLKPLLQGKKFRKNYEEGLENLRIAHSLVELREKQHLTQTQLAHRVGVSQPFIAKLETGESHNFSLKTLVKIAGALGAELDIRFRVHVPKAA